MKQKKEFFKTEIANLVFFWIFGVIFFLVFRLLFIFFYSDDISETTKPIDYFEALFMGFRFDMTVVCYFLAVPVLTTFILTPFKKYQIVVFIRTLFQSLFVILSVFISVITYNYYEEYKDQFNHFLFMGLYDDKIAVIQSIIADFHPVFNLFIILITIFTAFKILNYFEKGKNIYKILSLLKFRYNTIFVGILTLILFVGAIRGSFTEYPVRRFYASITSDTFLNKTIINPFRSLNNAIADYEELNTNYNDNPFQEVDKPITISEITKSIKKQTKTKINTKIDQIFILVLESYDSWPLMKDYKELKVSTNLKNIENKGIRFTNFLPAANTTMNSVAAIVSGVPYCGINISKIGAVKTFPSSAFKQFKALGYETNFFYGGYLSWQNIANFAKKQGANNVYGAGSSSAEKGIWGIDDESLYKMVLSKVNTTKKSINVILTTSYHTPYEVDIYSKGFKYKSINDLPEKIRKKYKENKMPLKTLGHLWYSDKALGDFVKKATKKYQNAIFTFTGDHFGRRFINGNPTLYESSSVPLIIYGKPIENISPQKNTTPGSHIDIMPTIFGLVSSPKSIYYSFGTNLLDNENRKDIGVGFNKLITKDSLFIFSKNTGIEAYDLKTKRKMRSFRNVLKRKHDSLMSLAWIYTVKKDSVFIE